MIKEKRLKHYKNYVSWRNTKGEFNTECNRASLPKGVVLTVATSNIPKIIMGGVMEEQELAVRRLTPLECLKAQGFTEDDYNAIKGRFSDSAIYHVAGDSISVSTLIGGVFGTMTNLDYRKITYDYVSKLKGDYLNGSR